MFKGNSGMTILLFRICSVLMQVLEKSFCFWHILNAMIYIFDFIHIAGNQWTRSLIIFLGLVYVIVIAKPWKTRDCVSCFVFRKTFVKYSSTGIVLNSSVVFSEIFWKIVVKEGGPFTLLQRKRLLALLRHSQIC